MYDNLSKYVCDKYYTIIDENGVLYTGYMLNYYCGNIVMLTARGILHLKYKNIEQIVPVKDYIVSEKLKEMVKDLNKEE